MNPTFETAARNLFAGPEPFFDAQPLFDPSRIDAQSIVAAYLLALGGNEPARTCSQCSSS